MVWGSNTGTFVVKVVDSPLIVIGTTGVPDTDSVGLGGDIVMPVLIRLLEIVIGRTGETAV